MKLHQAFTLPSDSSPPQRCRSIAPTLLRASFVVHQLAVCASCPLPAASLSHSLSPPCRQTSRSSLQQQGAGASKADGCKEWTGSQAIALAAPESWGCGARTCRCCCRRLWVLWIRADPAQRAAASAAWAASSRSFTRPFSSAGSTRRRRQAHACQSAADPGSSPGEATASADSSEGATCERTSSRCTTSSCESPPASERGHHSYARSSEC